MHLNIDVDHFQSTLVSRTSLIGPPLALFMLVFWASRKTLNKKNLKKSGFLVPLRAKVLPSWKEDDMNFPGRKCNTLYGFISLFLTNYFSGRFHLWKSRKRSTFLWKQGKTFHCSSHVSMKRNFLQSNKICILKFFLLKN